MRDNSYKHTFKDVDPTPKHPGKLNHDQYRRLFKPWRKRKLTQRVLREWTADHIVPDSPRGRKFYKEQQHANVA